MDLCGTELDDTPSYRLDAWIAQNLLPDEEFRVQCREAKGTVAELLEWCFQEDTVLKVVKAGSSAKGTALRNGSDADLVVFLGSFKSFKDMHIGHSDVIEEIHQMLNIHRQSIAKDIDIKEPKQHLDALGQPIPPRALSFSFRSRKVEKSISVDIVPAYKALDNIPSYVKPDPEVYVSLIRARGRPGEFSACFTKLQNNFVKPLPPKLKNLIRLVKHWYKQIVKPKYQGITLPPKYALELLTVYAWEQGCGAVDFRTDEGFCAVLQLLRQHQNLCIYWTTNYDFENPIVGDFLRRQLRMPRPVILDPADPTGVLGQGACWDLVAEEAEESLQSRCCINFVEPIQAWTVQPEVPIPRYDKQIFVKNPDGKTYTYQVRGKTSVLDLKRRIQKKARIPVEQQRLIYERKELQDENTLRYYRIPYKATLFVRVTEAEGRINLQ